MAIMVMFEVNGANSATKLDVFGAKLAPILQEMGIEAKPAVCGELIPGR